MHITHALGQLLGGRSRNLVATLIVACCATLALSISMPVPADAARPATSSALPDMASARGTGPVMPSGKAKEGQFSAKTRCPQPGSPGPRLQGARYADCAPAHVHVAPSLDASLSAVAQRRLPAGCRM